MTTQDLAEPSATNAGKDTREVWYDKITGVINSWSIVRPIRVKIPRSHYLIGPWYLYSEPCNPSLLLPMTMDRINDQSLFDILNAIPVDAPNWAWRNATRFFAEVYCSLRLEEILEAHVEGWLKTYSDRWDGQHECSILDDGSNRIVCSHVYGHCVANRDREDLLQKVPDVIHLSAIYGISVWLKNLPKLLAAEAYNMLIKFAAKWCLETHHDLVERDQVTLVDGGAEMRKLRIDATKGAV